MEFNAASQFGIGAISLFISLILPLWILGLVRKTRRDLEKAEKNRAAEFRTLVQKIAALQKKLDELTVE